MQAAKPTSKIPEDLMDSIPEKSQSTVEEKQEEVTEVEKIDVVKSLAEPKYTLTDEELTHYIYHGYVDKDIEIIPGKFTVTFRTLTGDETDLADEFFIKWAEGKSRTQNGLTNMRSIVMVSRAVIKLNGKALPTDHAGRFEQVRKLASIIIDKISAAYNELNFSIAAILNKENKLKN